MSIAGQRRKRASHELSRGQRTRRVMHDHQISRITVPGRRKRTRHRLRAHGPALDTDRLGGRGNPGRQRNDDALDVATVEHQIDAPLQQGAAGELDERLGAIGPQTLAAPGGDDQRKRQVSLR